MALLLQGLAACEDTHPDPPSEAQLKPPPIPVTVVSATTGTTASGPAVDQFARKPLLIDAFPTGEAVLSATTDCKAVVHSCGSGQSMSVAGSGGQPALHTLQWNAEKPDEKWWVLTSELDRANRLAGKSFHPVSRQIYLCTL